MRFVVEIPTGIARQLAEQIEVGVYESMDAAAAEAFRLLLGGNLARTSDAVAGVEPTSLGRERLLASTERGSVEGHPVFHRAPSPPWIWGMVNRVFPLKVAVRICSALCQEGAVSLAALRSKAAELAADLGKRLEAEDKRAGRRRNEGRSVGFPLRKPIDKAKLRFAMQFVGRRTSDGGYTGGVFETGLIGPVDPKADRVAPTATGWAFAALRNPVLDTDNGGDRNLSAEESSLYVTSVAAEVPAERAAFLSILTALTEGPLTPDDLSRRTRATTAAGMGEAVAVTARAGAIGRLIDIGTVHRETEGRSAVLTITDFGRAAIEALSKSHE